MVYEGDFVAGVIAARPRRRSATDADFFPFPSIDARTPPWSAAVTWPWR